MKVNLAGFGEVSVSFQYDEEQIATKATLSWKDPNGAFRDRIIPYLTYRKQQVFEEWDLANQRRQARKANKIHLRLKIIEDNLRVIEKSNGFYEFAETGLTLLGAKENYSKMTGRKYALRYALENAGFDKELRSALWTGLVNRGMNLSSQHKKEKQLRKKIEEYNKAVDKTDYVV